LDWPVSVRQAAFLEKIRPAHTEHAVAALIVELIRAADVLRVPRDAVKLGHAHAAAQEVAGSGPGVHAELARGDDLEATIRGEVGDL